MSAQLDKVKTFLLSLQENICHELEIVDGKACFQTDNWKKDTLEGGGITKVIANGDVFEKGGVNFSSIQAPTLPSAATQKRPELAGRPFHATGVSLVLHPDNPFIPTTHANFRYFTTLDDNPVWWFGGGYDLTPYYGYLEDCKHWHQTAKNACDPYGLSIYPHYKKWCDEYFYLTHRNEPRGVGGLFFDDLNDNGFEESFDLVRSMANSFLKAYLPIVHKRKSTPFTQTEKDFQLYRRGRYVEFNLIYDRGTLFGLQTNGRTESILMSLPPHVSWHYDWHPDKDSKEAELYEVFLKQQEWV